MNNNQPSLSIVIPSYNAGAFIEETLSSVLWQTYPVDRLEVIVVDDGSLDQTVSKAKKYLENSTLCHKIISIPNGGPSKARNHGWALAKGDWIQFLDADDLLVEHKISHQIEIACGVSEQVAVIYSPWQRIAENSKQEWLPTDEIVRPDIGGDAIMDLLKTENIIATGSQLFRRAWLERVGGFNEQRKFIEDVELLLKIAMAGGGFVKADSERPLFFYRKHHKSLSRSDPQAFMDGCVINGGMAEQFWTEAQNNLSLQQRKLLLELYGNAARFYFEHDQPQFQEVYQKLLNLDSNYIPESPKALKYLSSFIGYPNAEALALVYRKAKNLIKVRRVGG